jgi:hypothetical protein
MAHPRVEGGEDDLRLLIVIKSLRLEGSCEQTNNKQTPWPLIRKRTIPTERPPALVNTVMNIWIFAWGRRSF